MDSIKFIHTNNNIQVENILSIRLSYPIEHSNKDLITKRYSQELSEIDNRLFIIGFDNKNFPIGYVQLILQNADNDIDLADGKRIAHIHDLRIRNELQSHGYGKKMMEHLEKLALNRGIKTLTLGVDNFNSRAIQLYSKLGYFNFKNLPGQTENEFVNCMRKNLLLE